VAVGEQFTVLNQIRWLKTEGWHHKTDKEELRSYLSPWEAVIFAEQVGADGSALMRSGYAAACEDLRRFIFEPLRAYLDGERERAGINFEQVRQMVGCAPGSGLPSHWFTRSQWLLPTAEQYAKLRHGFNADGSAEYLRREYEDLRREYEDLRRPFAVSDRGRWHDTWDFATVPAVPGKHPCEKPLALLEHAIRTSTRPGGLVLDSCAGSGSTIRAATNLGRRAIGIEIEERYCEIAAKRLAQMVLPLETPEGFSQKCGA